MDYDAFISYRRSNGFLMAQVVHDQLKSKGIKCFLDLEELHAGTFDDKLLDAIRSAPNFILILPSGSLDRCVDENDWVRKEIQEAVKLQKTIIPVMYDGFTWPEWDDRMPDEIRHLERVNAVTGTQEYLPAMIDKIINYMTGLSIRGRSAGLNSDHFEVLHMATSNLTVVDSIIQGSCCDELFREYGFRVEKHPYKWSDKILKDLLEGALDIAVYNKESCLTFNREHDNKIQIIRDVCSSMGGRNFYILASVEGKWTNMTLEQFKEKIDGNTVFGVSKSSDMYNNLLFILDMTEQELTDRGVKIMNYHADQGLDIFDIMPDILIIAGQDIRFLAEKTGKFREIISYEDFPQEKKQFFLKNSVNSLMIGPSGQEKLREIDPEVIGRDWMLNFYTTAMSPELLAEMKKKLSRQLNNLCDDPACIDYILEKILFETYRIF